MILEKAEFEEQVEGTPSQEGRLSVAVLDFLEM